LQRVAAGVVIDRDAVDQKTRRCRCRHP
jgi:hypothetical protein